MRSSLMEDDVALAVHLAMIEGHLRAATWLYAEDHPEQASMHARHPRAELLGGLRSALQARGLEPLDVELRRLAVYADRASLAARRDVLLDELIGELGLRSAEPGGATVR